jgi:hypothetical protein
MTRLLTIVAIGALLGTLCTATSGLEAPVGIAISAASKKSATSARRQEPGQIACTVSGCQRIPPNCHPQTGYNWDGIPTGFDIVVCHHPRGGRG